MSDNSKHKLHQLSYAGKLKEIKGLLNLGVDVNEQDDKGCTALYIAAELGNSKLINLLCAHDADANIHNQYGELPLSIAIRSGNTKSIEILLSCTKNVSKQDRYGNTALHFAVSAGNLSFVKSLLERSALINYVNEQGNTALSIAQQNNYNEIAKLLAKHGGKKTIDTIDAIKYSYRRCNLCRKLVMMLFSLMTIGGSIIANVFTAGELILAVFDSVGASIGMMMVCLERPYHEFRMLEKKKLNEFYKAIQYS
jgi:ankyrin repeat protein